MSVVRFVSRLGGIAFVRDAVSEGLTAVRQCVRLLPFDEAVAVAVADSTPEWPG